MWPSYNPPTRNPYFSLLDVFFRLVFLEICLGSFVPSGGIFLLSIRFRAPSLFLVGLFDFSFFPTFRTWDFPLFFTLRPFFNHLDLAPPRSSSGGCGCFRGSAFFLFPLLTQNSLSPLCDLSVRYRPASFPFKLIRFEVVWGRFKTLSMFPPPFSLRRRGWLLLSSGVTSHSLLFPPKAPSPGSYIRNRLLVAPLFLPVSSSCPSHPTTVLHFFGGSFHLTVHNFK